MDAMTRKGLENLVAGLKSQEDLDEAADVLRQRWGQMAGAEVMRFRPGQRVRWYHRGALHTGTVRRRNTRTLAVAEEGTGVMWRIGPSAPTAGSGESIGF